jgi:hypothetical protein
MASRHKLTSGLHGELSGWQATLLLAPLAPQTIEVAAGGTGVAYRVLNIPMAERILNPAHVNPAIGHSESGRVVNAVAPDMVRPLF